MLFANAHAKAKMMKKKKSLRRKVSTKVDPAEMWKMLQETIAIQKEAALERKKADAERQRADAELKKLEKKLAAELAADRRHAAMERKKAAAERKKAAAEAEAERKKAEAERKKEEAERKKEEIERKKAAAKADAEIKEHKRRLDAEVAEVKKETEKAQKEAAVAKKEADEARKQTEVAQQRAEAAFERAEKGQAELQKSLDKAYGNFNNKWGQFLENLSAGDFLKLIKQVGIEGVDILYENLVRHGKNGETLAEIDFVGANTTDAVVGEVKTHLTKNKVDHIVDKIKKHGPFLLKQYKRVYVAIIFLKAEKGAVDHAIKKGLIVIQSPGRKTNLSALVNEKGFKPRAVIG